MGDLSELSSPQAARGAATNLVQLYNTLQYMYICTVGIIVIEILLLNTLNTLNYRYSNLNGPCIIKRKF